MALQKSRRGEGDEDRPEKFVLVEETDPPTGNSVLNGPQSGKKGAKGKKKRVLDSSENVYLVQLAWKGAGRLILEEKEKLLREGQLHMDLGHHNPHLNVCETHSDPIGGLSMAGKVSPRIRRSSKIIASGVRRISRSFYGGESSSSSSSHGSGMNLNVPGHGVPSRRPKQRRVTTAAAMSPSPSALSALSAPNGDADVKQHHHLAAPGSSSSSPRRSSSARMGGERRHSHLTAAASPSLEPGSDPGSLEVAANGKLQVPGGGEEGEKPGRKLSKVNLRKLKIW